MINWKLYVILDKALSKGKDLKTLTEEIIAGGADVIQFRDKASTDEAFLKDAEAVRNITKNSGVDFIVNDRLDIAKEIDADGVHLGQGDLSIAEARTILGKSSLIGESCHSIEQAINAESEGANYIGFGAIFKTSTRPELKPIGYELIDEVRRNIKIPFVCIGGINETNLDLLLRYGAQCVAVCSAIICSNNPQERTCQLKEILEHKHDPVRICQK